MLQFTRFTTAYSEQEDRISLAGAADAGEARRLWLTRRLLDRLLPHLTLWLERQYDAMPRADLLHEFAQQEALAGLTPQPPVRPEAAAEHLVTAVDLAPADGELGLVFKNAAGQLASVSFAPQPLRQWLAIVHQCYRSADWPLSAWPQWMGSETPPAESRLWH